MNFKFLIFLLAIIVVIPYAFSQYYGDLQIAIDEKGETSITGLSNIPSIDTPVTTDTLTAKKGAHWTFNLTTNQTIESYVYEVTLPQNAQINYIKTSEDFRLEENNGNLKVISSGNNKPLNIIIQYQLSSNNTNETEIPYLVLLGITIIIGGIFGILINKILANNSQISSKASIDKNYKAEQIDMSVFSKRQKDIIELLLKEKKITQKYLESYLDIPKSSLSRNLATLEVKGYIKREKIGQTTYIQLQ